MNNHRSEDQSIVGEPPIGAEDEESVADKHDVQDNLDQETRDALSELTMLLSYAPMVLESVFDMLFQKLERIDGKLERLLALGEKGDGEEKRSVK